MFRLLLECEEAPGLLAKIVVAIRAVGLEPENQKFRNNDGVRLVRFDFTSGSQELVVSAMKAVKKIDGVNKAKAYRAKDPGTEGASFDLNDYIQKASDEYPNIDGLVAEVREAHEDPEEASEQLAAFGRGVARARFQNGAIAQDGTLTIEETLAAIANEELKDLASSEYVSEGFETGLMVNKSIFTATGDSKSSHVGTFGSLESEAHRCDFLAAYIQEALNLSLGNTDSSITVEETRCRNEGHPYCLFEYSS